MPRDLLRKSPSLNHTRNLLADPRHHWDSRFHLPRHYCHPGPAVAAAAVAVAIAADVDYDRQGQGGLFSLLALLLVYYF